jgi:hypothetical protein
LGAQPTRITRHADACSAGVGHHDRDRNEKPIEIIMACAAGRISIGDGRYWARTSDPQLVELVLSQLS